MKHKGTRMTKTEYITMDYKGNVENCVQIEIKRSLQLGNTTETSS